MSEEIRAPFLSYENIRGKADEFLGQHHPEGIIPVPIERIVEFKLGMDIVPVPGLRGVIEAEGFTTSDLQEIHVDGDTYERHRHRYRFTLAHEVGHVVLHAEVFEKGQWGNIAGWKAFVNSISEKEHSWLEYHAYSFGGLVLVPRDHLFREAKECVGLIDSEGIDLEEHWDFAWTRIAAHLARRFDVSVPVIEKRLDKDGVKEGSDNHPYGQLR